MNASTKDETITRTQKQRKNKPYRRSNSPFFARRAGGNNGRTTSFKNNSASKIGEKTQHEKHATERRETRERPRKVGHESQSNLLARPRATSGRGHGQANENVRPGREALAHKRDGNSSAPRIKTISLKDTHGKNRSKNGEKFVHLSDPLTPLRTSAPKNNSPLLSHPLQPPYQLCRNMVLLTPPRKLFEQDKKQGRQQTPTRKTQYVKNKE